MKKKKRKLSAVQGRHVPPISTFFSFTFPYSPKCSTTLQIFSIFFFVFYFFFKFLRDVLVKKSGEPF